MKFNGINKNKLDSVPRFNELSHESIILSIKLIAMLILAAITFIFGLMPLYCSFCGKNETILSLANSFAGGLFFGIVLFHLIPDSANTFEEYFNTNNNNSIFKGKPNSLFIVFLSYSFILLLEKVVLPYFLNKYNNDASKDTNDEEENIPLTINEEKNINKAKKGKNSIPYMILFALAVHGLFEGTALGVMNKLKPTIFLFIAIVSHKWAESFSLGINIYKSNFEKAPFIIVVTLFATFAPIGILIGIVCSSINQIFEGILLGISSGILLYLSCNEIIMEEFENNKNPGYKFIFYLMGAILVGGLVFLEDE